VSCAGALGTLQVSSVAPDAVAVKHNVTSTTALVALTGAFILFWSQCYLALCSSKNEIFALMRYFVILPPETTASRSLM
jgi:hypothetical protein